MSWFWRIVVFVPAVYLIMIVYSALHAATAGGVLEIAGKKAIKVLAWSIVMVLAMLIIEYLFLP